MSSKTISVDTEMLRSLAQQAGRANDSITEASEQMNQIHIHNSWKCKEKARINENVMECKAQMRKLQDDTAGFCRALEKASDEFNSAEDGIAGLFQEVEQIIGDALSGAIVSSEVIGQSISGQIKEIIAQIRQPQPWHTPDFITGPIKIFDKIDSDLISGLSKK